MSLKRRRIPRSPETEVTYPPYVVTVQDRERWVLAAAIARQVFGDVDEASVWIATRAVYSGPIPTEGHDD